MRLGNDLDNRVGHLVMWVDVTMRIIRFSTAPVGSLKVELNKGLGDVKFIRDLHGICLMCTAEVSQFCKKIAVLLYSSVVPGQIQWAVYAYMIVMIYMIYMACRTFVPIDRNRSLGHIYIQVYTYWYMTVWWKMYVVIIYIHIYISFCVHFCYDARWQNIDTIVTNAPFYHNVLFVLIIFMMILTRLPHEYKNIMSIYLNIWLIIAMKW